MRAAIDIGSNTVQMLAGEIKDGMVVPRLRHLATTRLGGGLCSRVLPASGIEETVSALLGIKNRLLQAGVGQVRLVATSAVRDAENRDEFLREVRRVCGWTVDVLSGEEEAMFSFLGAAGGTEGPALVIDIGGGSTEVIRRDERGLTAQSADVGAVRVQSGRWTWERIVSSLAEVFSASGAGERAVGVGGTITTAAALLSGVSEYSREAVQGKIIRRADAQKLVDALLPLSVELRCSWSPLLARRGEVMVEGLFILLALWDILAFGELRVSDAGLLDGVLLNWA
ncbi:MAG: hypothetical protein FWD39_00590 [Clostridiales bacterium]|nr:hypothetical protein [Clostridiales bacterium]